MKRPLRSPLTQPLRYLVIRRHLFCGTINRYRLDKTTAWRLFCVSCGQELDPFFPLEEWLELMGFKEPHTLTHIHGVSQGILAK